MSDPITRLFATAGEQANTASLAGAAAARQVGTRRRRVRVATIGTVCALVVAVIPVGVTQVTGSRQSPMPPATSPTPSLSASPDVSPSKGPGLPPDRCSATPAQCYPPLRYWYDERLPAPCAQPSHPSDTLVATRESNARSAPFDLSQPSTTTYAVTLTRYRAGGAAQYMAEVRSALSRCGTVSRNTEFTTQKTTLTYRQVGNGGLGDDSLLASRSYRYVTEGQPPSNPVFLIAVIRIGDVVAVVYDYGWEGSPSPRSRFDAFVAEATAQLRAGKP